jgi:ubiquinol-cytochrome c reductase cytochrome c subunit
VNGGHWTSRRRFAAIAAGALLAVTTLASAQVRSGVVHVPNGDSLPLEQQGAQLYAANCSTCHGIDGRGVSTPRPGAGDVAGLGPALTNAGAQAADFYLRTGYMPLDKPTEQPYRHRVLFSDREVKALVAYVATLDHGPPVPRVHPENGSLSEGLELFTEHCAGCHQVAGRGGVATGARVPPLDKATPTEIAEAVRIGPYVMPSFSRKDITDRQLDSIIAYVRRTQHPVDRGGWGIGNLGPFPEGMVTWLIGGVALIVFCMLIGSRTRRS